MNFIHLNGSVEKVSKATDHEVLGYDSCMEVRVNRNFLDMHGDFNSFLIDVYLWKGAKKNVLEQIETSSNIIVHGRVDVIDKELVVIAEQIKVI